MHIVIGIVFLFAFGSISGWVLELFFRRIVSRKHWINPGFLNGPYLPLYGFSTILLFYISNLAIPLWARVAVFIIIPTLFELATGLVFTKYFNIRLWDYTNQPLSYKGIICPLFTTIWGGLGVLFYYTLYPVLFDRLDFLIDHPELSFFVGVFLGIIILDTINSFDVANQIRKRIRETGHRIQVNYGKLKLEVRSWAVEHTSRNLYKRYMSTFNGHARKGLMHSLEKQIELFRQGSRTARKIVKKDRQDS